MPANVSVIFQFAKWTFHKIYFFYIHSTRYYILCNPGILFCSTVKSVRNINKWVELLINGLSVQEFIIETYRGGGHSTFLFGGCVPHGFPKVGSRERISLEKMRGLGNNNLESLHIERWNFCQNKAENAKSVLKIENGGAHKWRIDGKLVG